MTDGPPGARGRTDRTRDGTGSSSWTERLLMAASALFTLLLFAYLIWQGAMTPVSAVPTATVSGTQTLAGEDVRVTVVLRNGQDVGLVAATVAVDCDSPPPEITFEHVPADDRRRGYVTCPSGTEDPAAIVSTWTEA